VVFATFFGLEKAQKYIYLFFFASTPWCKRSCDTEK